MTTILIRTFIIYLILITAMRLMGKRQIGELEVSDLVTTILISEIASLPLTNTSIPISHAIVPTVTLLTLEVISAFLIAKFPRVKNLLTARPSILIKKGHFCKKAMIDARISPDELIGELRQQGVTSPEEVLYAILEQNGTISIMERGKSNLAHPVIIDGDIVKKGVRAAGISKEKISRALSEAKLTEGDVFLMTIDDRDKVRIIKKESKK